MNFSRRDFIATTALAAVSRPFLLVADEQTDAVVRTFSRTNLTFTQSNDVNLGGFFGTRYRQSLERLSKEPIDVVDFVIDDVNFNQKRRFFNYSGDISGRYIEICSLASTNYKTVTAMLPEVIDYFFK